MISDHNHRRIIVTGNANYADRALLIVTDAGQPNNMVRGHWLRFARALVVTNFADDEQFDEAGNLLQNCGRALSNRLCTLLKDIVTGIGPPSMWAAAGWEFGGYYDSWQVWFHVGDAGEMHDAAPVWHISVSVHLGPFTLGRTRKLRALGEVCRRIDGLLRTDSEIRLLKWLLYEDRWFRSPIERDWDLNAEPLTSGSS